MAALLPMLVLLLSAIFAVPAVATTYEVGPGKPHTSLQSVAPLLGPGDLVLVEGNATYPGGVVLDRAGTAAQPIVIRGGRAGGARPRISGATNTLEVRANHYVLEFALPCAATASTTAGSTCTLSSTFNAIVPGAVVDGKLAVWELKAVEVYDDDDDVFQRQGVFVP